jgi:ABC-type dipeptide/oligopeptide/nickel transport system permease component
MATPPPVKEEPDSLYILKLVLYLIVGSQWLKIQTKTGAQISIPYGALLGLLFATHDHFRIDRKIEYAVLLVAMFVGFWIPIGLILTFH